VTWRGLIPEDSKFKDEIEFTMVTLKYVGVRNGNKSRNRKTPVMTLQGLQRLLVILGGGVTAEFRQIVLGVFTRYEIEFFMIYLKHEKLTLRNEKKSRNRKTPVMTLRMRRQES